jgi:lysylphosphatidylglycerol synthetase-like protein (DUF2156 family)
MISEVPREIRIELLKHHGNFPLAYSSTLQPDLQHFGDRRGFVAYRRVWGSALCLSNPVAPRSHWQELIGRFVEAKGDVCWWQISHPVAEALASLGFWVNRMGIETRVDLAGYTFDGPAKRSFRRAVARLADRGDVIHETSPATFEAHDLQLVSDSWRRTRTTKKHEMSFLVRPGVLADEVDVRKFFTVGRDGRLLAFGFFDPVYEHGEIVGYLCSTKRWLPEADSLTGYAMMRCAIETFQREGRKHLFLGLSPLADLSNEEFEGSKLAHRVAKFVSRNTIFNRSGYPIRGLTAHKLSYCGISEPTYYAFNRRPSLKHLLILAKACNIF